jgi:surface antigen
MKFKGMIAALLMVFAVSACENSDYGTKQTVGAVLGAAGGGLLGSQFGSGRGQLAATAAGAVLGGLLGSEVGRSLDETDRLRAQQAYTQASSAPVGETIRWNNPDSGNYGYVTPVRDGTSTSGAYCREFQQTVVIGGKTETAYGTACREPDGSWRIVNS